MKLACLAALLAAFAWTRPATACGQSPLPQPSLKGVPVEGQADVPTDVVPVYDLGALNLFSASDDGQFALHSESGEAVAITLEAVANGYVALHPKAALQPNTSYVIEAALPQYVLSDAETVSLTFTTGAGPLSASPPPALEFASLRFWTAPQAPVGCFLPSSGGCVAIPAGEWVQVDYPGINVSQQVSTYLFNGPFRTAIVDEALLDGEHCIELRRRALNGVLGAPTELCRADRPLLRLSRDAAASCSEDGVSVTGDSVTAVESTPYNDVLDDSNAANSETSCSLAHRPPSGRTVLTPLVVLGAALARRARRRR